MLLRLEKKGLVFKKSVQAHTNEHVWILTKRGADELNAQSEGDSWARDGHDLGFTRLQKDKLVLERGIEKIKKNHLQSALLGRAGIRAKLPSEYRDCDAVFVEIQKDNAPVPTGLIAVLDARQSLVDRVLKLQKQGLNLEFVGNDKTIGLLLKRVAQAAR